MEKRSRDLRSHFSSLLTCPTTYDVMDIETSTNVNKHQHNKTEFLLAYSNWLELTIMLNNPEGDAGEALVCAQSAAVDEFEPTSGSINRLVDHHNIHRAY